MCRTKTTSQFKRPSVNWNVESMSWGTGKCVEVALEPGAEALSFKLITGLNPALAVSSFVSGHPIAPGIKNSIAKHGSNKGKTHLCGTGRDNHTKGDRRMTVGNSSCWPKGFEHRIQKHIVTFHRRHTYGNARRGFFGRCGRTESWTLYIGIFVVVCFGLLGGEQ